MRALLVNGVCFQLAWWLLILLGGWHSLWVVPLFLVAHRIWIAPWRQLWQGWLPLLPVLMLGLGFDATLFATGLLGPSSILPLWLGALWICFVASLPFSLSWFVKNPWFGVPSFAVLGPLSYLAGMALTPVEASRGVELWLAFAVPFWALLIPFIHLLRRGRHWLLLSDV